MDSITMGGPPGSGTSTVCKLLKERLGIEYLYAGQIFRDKAKELGLTLAEFGDLCKKDRSYDLMLDEEMLDQARSGDILIEGRMIGPLCKKYGVPSFKIYIDADKTIRAKRVQERDGGILTDVIRNMEEREESEASRYINYYHIDPRKTSWYDQIIDSTHLSPDEELEIILKELEWVDQ